MSDLDLQAKLRHNALEFPWSEPPEQGHLRELADGLLWLRMPLPFGLDHINLYLLRHEHGWVVVDTGLNTDFTDVLENRNAVVTYFRPESACTEFAAEYDRGARCKCS